MLLAAAAGRPAWANDTVARVGAGGLVFEKSSEIRMLSENLTISPTRIAVQYRFRNEAPRAVDTVVAFPMPAFYWDPEQMPNWKNIGPVDTFVIEVNGQAVAAAIERKAMLGERDITAALRQAGLSESQIFRTFGDAEGMEGVQLPDSVVARLRDLKAVEGTWPSWRVLETAHWRQTFPARRDLSVRHAYRPFTGRVYSNYDKSRLAPQPDILRSSKDDGDQACLDEGGSRAVENRLRKLLGGGARSVYVEMNDVEYVLGTGRNWKGAIGEFTLNISKESPDQIVSLCFPGKPARVDNKTLQFKMRNYTPQDKLLLNFYTLAPLKD
ncbi:DUF4424 family protein [Pseudoduganella sp. LjRoot289]|uniref:DUF4424 family protein n=1 Tax=Pseudoduganella sp. LjRoot289 TaxID=3342314 RepID=UPI003ECE4986